MVRKLKQVMYVYMKGVFANDFVSLSLDAVCLVIKKTDDEEHLVRETRALKSFVCDRGWAVVVTLHVCVFQSSVFKSKNRHRKKKQKEFKVSVVSATATGQSASG